MKLILERKYLKNDYTIGNLYINDLWFCNTLEDKVRIKNCNCKQKKKGMTAVPEGQYKVEMLWWEKHKDYYPHLKDVPCFEGILIHSGNDETDTEGCILVGYNKVVGGLIESRMTYLRLQGLCLMAIKQGEEITIEIK